MAGTIFEGQGTGFTMTGLTLNPKEIEIPGWSKEEIEITNLNNTNFKTFILAKLKKVGEIVLKLEFDPSVFIALPEGNTLITISFDGITEKLNFWGDIKEAGSVPQQTDTQPTFDVTILVTNLNDLGVETGPFSS